MSHTRNFSFILCDDRQPILGDDKVQGSSVNFKQVLEQQKSLYAQREEEQKHS